MDALPAVVNHGRWLVRCPFCNSAALTVPENPIFVCLDCRNAEVGGKPVPVKWPRGHLRIDAILSVRPMPENRNWEPHETLNDLMRENREHGL